MTSGASRYETAGFHTGKDNGCSVLIRAGKKVGELEGTYTEKLTGFQKKSQLHRQEH